MQYPVQSVSQVCAYYVIVRQQWRCIEEYAYLTFKQFGSFFGLILLEPIEKFPYKVIVALFFAVP